MNKEKYNWNYGMITPDGKFYGCRYMGHYALADELLETYTDLMGTIIINGTGALVEGYADSSFMGYDEYVQAQGHLLLTDAQVKTCKEIIAHSKHNILVDEALDALQWNKNQKWFAKRHEEEEE